VFKSKFFLNPIRNQKKTNLSYKKRIILGLRDAIIYIGCLCGFQNIDYSYVHGRKKRVHIGENCSTMNSIFNVISGHITLGDNTIVGHNCMFLTGTHNFTEGVRASLVENNTNEETPTSGRNIKIGYGCFIGSGAIIVGPVTIGDNVIVGAGAVVTKDIPGNCFVAGSPAKIIKNF
jgi:acetyltransferase-like isoleucine patch superfamily enzyme